MNPRRNLQTRKFRRKRNERWKRDNIKVEFVRIRDLPVEEILRTGMIGSVSGFGFCGDLRGDTKC